MKAHGTVRIRGADGAIGTYEGSFVLDDGGVWLALDGDGKVAAELAAILGAEAGPGKWLFLPLDRVVLIATDANPAE